MGSLPYIRTPTSKRYQPASVYLYTCVCLLTKMLATVCVGRDYSLPHKRGGDDASNTSNFHNSPLSPPGLRAIGAKRPLFLWGFQVYGYMDKYRRQTKQIKTASSQSTRAARIAVSRQRRRQQERGRRRTAEPDGGGKGYTSPLRRYSDLNLGLMPSRAARPVTSNGLIL